VKRLSFRLCVLSLVLPQLASASIFGEENISLAALVAQSATQINQLVQTLEQAKKTYDETRKYVGMAQDAVKAFHDFQTYGNAILQQPDQALRQLLPDGAYLHDELRSPERWAKGTGELQRLVSVCLSGGGHCAEFRERVQAEQAKQAIRGTFGTSPLPNAEAEVLDTEAARALAQGTVDQGKSKVAAEQSKALMEKCLRGSGAEAVSACQAAANAAQILQVEGTAQINSQLAISNRLQALQVAAQSAEEKQRTREALQREKAVEAGIKFMRPPKIILKTEGDGPWGSQQ
jgi:hypothetical protein